MNIKFGVGSYIRFEQIEDGFKVMKGEGLLSLKGRFKLQAAITGTSVDDAVQAAREVVARERAER